MVLVADCATFVLTVILWDGGGGGGDMEEPPVGNGFRTESPPEGRGFRTGLATMLSMIPLPASGEDSFLGGAPAGRDLLAADDGEAERGLPNMRARRLGFVVLSVTSLLLCEPWPLGRDGVSVFGRLATDPRSSLSGRGRFADDTGVSAAPAGLERPALGWRGRGVALEVCASAGNDTDGRGVPGPFVLILIEGALGSVGGLGSAEAGSASGSLGVVL